MAIIKRAMTSLIIGAALYIATFLSSALFLLLGIKMFVFYVLLEEIIKSSTRISHNRFVIILSIVFFAIFEMAVKLYNAYFSKSSSLLGENFSLMTSDIVSSPWLWTTAFILPLLMHASTSIIYSSRIRILYAFSLSSIIHVLFNYFSFFAVG